MNFSEYLGQAKRTMRLEWPEIRQLKNIKLGIMGESGEVADILKKHWFHGHDLNRGHLKEELGDLLFYIAWLFVNDTEFLKSIDYEIQDWKVPTEMADDYEIIETLELMQKRVIGELKTDQGILLDILCLIEYLEFTFEEVATYNIEKLKKRYKGDGFTEKESRER